MPPQGRLQQQHQHGQGMGPDRKPQCRQGDVIQKQLQFDPEIRQGEQQQGDRDKQACPASPHWGPPSTGQQWQKGRGHADARPAAHRNADGQGHSEPEQAAAAEEDQGHQG